MHPPQPREKQVSALIIKIIELISWPNYIYVLIKTCLNPYLFFINVLKVIKSNPRIGQVRRPQQQSRVRREPQEASPQGGHHGAAQSCQHPRAQTHVQPERGVRQTAPQSADIRVREATFADRDSAAGHHVHLVHERAAERRQSLRPRRRGAQGLHSLRAGQSSNQHWTIIPIVS